MRTKEEASKQGQTNKAKQHSTPKAVTFPKKNELPRVGLEPTTLYMYIHVHVVTCITVMYMHVVTIQFTALPLHVHMYRSSLSQLCRFLTRESFGSDSVCGW